MRAAAALSVRIRDVHPETGLAAIFGIPLLVAVDLSRIWQADWALARYDALLIYALGPGGVSGHWHGKLARGAGDGEHLTGTIMEIFKVVPQLGLSRDGLAGCAAVLGFHVCLGGVYMARVIRLFDMRLTPTRRSGWRRALRWRSCEFLQPPFLPDIRLALLPRW